MKGRTEPVWLAIASFGIAAAAFGVGWAPVFPVALVCLLIMGTSDGITMVAENGIMQRRTPDALRSRTMAAFDAVLSCGLAIAYILAARVLRTFGPQPVYRIGGVTALLAALMLSRSKRRSMRERAGPRRRGSRRWGPWTASRSGS